MPTPTFDVEITKDGKVFKKAELDTMLSQIGTFTDVFVMSHGWNNDKNDAKKHYGDLLANIDKLLDQRTNANLPANMKPVIDPLKTRTFAAVRIFWPSKRFTDKELIPGGGAATAQAHAENEKELNKYLVRLMEEQKTLGDSKIAAKHKAVLEKLTALTPKLATIEAQREFVRLIRGVLDDSQAENDDASRGFFEAPAETLFAQAAAPVIAPAGTKGGNGASFGGATGLGDILEGVQAAARRIANFATYYQMKSRAGKVGEGAVASMIKSIRTANPQNRIHLIGHSFGGRVITAAAHKLDANTQNVSMSLLQSAFSHNALSGGFGDKNPKDVGFFRSLVADKRVSGPIIITHTKNDKAVGIAYPLASRIAGQNAAAVGDQNDPYGGMGRNGAQHTTEATNTNVMGLPGTTYRFKPGGIHNVLSDVITDHGDVERMEVAYCVLSNVAAV